MVEISSIFYRLCISISTKTATAEILTWDLREVSEDLVSIDIGRSVRRCDTRVEGAPAHLTQRHTRHIRAINPTKKPATIPMMIAPFLGVSMAGLDVDVDVDVAVEDIDVDEPVPTIQVEN